MKSEIRWRRRETRRSTENTNFALRFWPGEIPEGLSGSERLAWRKRSVENLRYPNDSWRNRHGMRILSHIRGNPDTEVSRNLNRTECRVCFANLIEGGQKIVGKTDWPIVLRVRESRIHGEGASRVTQPAKET
jgi:hypothetical protein